LFARFAKRWYSELVATVRGEGVRLIMDAFTSSPSAPRPATPFSTLRRFAAPRSAPAPEPEKCELCRVPLAPEHRHLLEVAKRQIACACDPCALRFENVLEGRFKLVPRDAHTLPGFRLDDAEWDALALPIGLAFFIDDTRAGKVTALYPSPAGATESLLPLEAWHALVAGNHVLTHLQPDVEALLVNRVGEHRDYYLAPIDSCYELVGLIRRYWRGFTGGEEVWRNIDAFFARLNERARPLAREETPRA
jgi:hypothetical protein